MPTFTPNQKINKLRAICRRCRRGLLSGQGFGWQVEDDSLVNSPTFYLCARCHKDELSAEKTLAQAASALAMIGSYLWARSALGFVEERRVRDAVIKAGPRAVVIAREIATRIELGESFSVWQIVRMLEGGGAAI